MVGDGKCRRVGHRLGHRRLGERLRRKELPKEGLRGHRIGILAVHLLPKWVGVARRRRLQGPPEAATRKLRSAHRTRLTHGHTTRPCRRRSSTLASFPSATRPTDYPGDYLPAGAPNISRVRCQLYLPLARRRPRDPREGEAGAAVMAARGPRSGKRSRPQYRVSHCQLRSPASPVNPEGLTLHGSPTVSLVNRSPSGRDELSTVSQSRPTTPKHI